MPLENGRLKDAAEELRSQIDDIIEDLKEDPRMDKLLKLHNILNSMEELIGLPSTSLSALFALDSSTVIPPGEFYGLSALKAAKRLLKIRGKGGASLSEIVAAVRTGGAKVESVERLKVSLGRSTADVAKVGKEHYALLEFYPHVQRGKKDEDEVTSSVISEEDDAVQETLGTSGT